MNIDACFILSAGYGTRMGEIGEHLPKPMWPIFNQSLISATVNYWRNFGIKKFYANVHHLADQIIPHLKELGVTPILEEKLLGSGGAFHNLKLKHPSLSRVLSVNCDNFAVSFDHEKFLSELGKQDQMLFSMPVESGQRFNRLVLEDGKLVGILKEFSSPGVTYSGVGVINLDLLSLSKNESGFFDSVVKLNKSTSVINGVFEEFIDFGTAENYFNSSFNFIHPDQYKKLKEYCKIEVKDYIQQQNIIAQKLDSSFENVSNTIILEATEATYEILKNGCKNSLIYRDVIQSAF